MGLKLFAFILLVGVSLGVEDYAGYKLIRTHPRDTKDAKHLQAIAERYDFWTERIAAGHPVDILVAPERFATLQEYLTARRIPMEIINRDISGLVKSSGPGAKKGTKLDWTDYYSHEDILAFMEEIAGANDFAEIFEVGTSFEGRRITGIHLNPGGATNTVWIDGGIHAREWISPATVTYFINQIIQNYDGGQDADLINSFNWYIVPLQNPDGYEHTRAEARLWRKNRNTQHDPFCIGTDLNRNWDFHWMEIGASDNPCSEVFAGPEPESEPEVQAVRDYVLDLVERENVVIFLTLHSYSQVWLSPWGYGFERPEDYDDLVALMDPVVEALTAVHGTFYEYGTSTEVLGPAAGASDDWGKGVAMVKHSYTIELRDRGFYGFLLPPEQILPTGEETWEGVKVAVQKSVEIQ